MDLTPFLAISIVIDGDHPDVHRLAKSVWREDELGTIQTAYRVVRDEFAHSYDIGANEVSVSASDVFHHGHGICFAKAHLLAALLRVNGIPTGLCYQKFVRRDQSSAATFVHGLNAVWLNGSWRRLDARGNRPNTKAPFDPDCERLAYTTDPTLGEHDYREVLPNHCTVYSLRFAAARLCPSLTTTCPPIAARIELDPPS